MAIKQDCRVGWFPVGRQVCVNASDYFDSCMPGRLSLIKSGKGFTSAI